MRQHKTLFLTYLLPLLFLGVPSSAFSFTTPLDSIKQVLRILEIPYDVREEWMEDLEELEDQQNTKEFKELLADVDTKIKAYLGNPKGYKPEKPKKKRFQKSLKNIADKVNQGVKSTEILAALELGKNSEKYRNWDNAIRHYSKAADLLSEQEKWRKWVEVSEKIADIKAAHQKDYEGALAMLPSIKAVMRDLGDGEGMREIDTKTNNLQKNLNISVAKEAPPLVIPRTPTPNPPVTSNSPVTPPQPPTIIRVPEITAEIKEQEAQMAKIQVSIETRKKEMEVANRQLREAEKNRDNRAIAALQKKLDTIEKKRQDEIQAAESARNELNQKRLLLEAELSKKEAAQLRLYGGLAILGLLLFSTFIMYRSKKKDHKKLALAYNELEEAQEALTKAKEKIKGLLDQQVSGAVAAELLSEESLSGAKKERRFVCIMFLDIRNFTPFVESKTPEEIIEYQNNVLGFMMEKVIEHDGIVNSVLGDGFMATFGAPISTGNDCLQAYKAAVEILQMVREKSRTGQIPATKIGIGMHAGNVVAGNVGTKTRKQYLISGNTVIIAARLEQLNKQYGSSLIISREVVEQLPKAMNLPNVFDKVMVKGRSKPVEIAKYG